ncbi:MAG TPA: hypothetical protein VGN88_05580, partial [Phycisphaerae bacterium]
RDVPAQTSQEIPAGTRVQPASTRSGMSPGMVALLAAPVTIAVTMILGGLLVWVLGVELHPREMVGAAMANMLGGVAASLPLFFLMRARRNSDDAGRRKAEGGVAIAQGAMIGIALRIGIVLMGMVFLQVAGVGLQMMVLAYWVMGFYFPVLMAETAVVAWLSQRAE